MICYYAAWNLNWRTNAGTTRWAYYVDGKNQVTNGTVLGAMEYDANGNLVSPSRLSIPYSFEYDDVNVSVNDDVMASLATPGASQVLPIPPRIMRI